MKIILIFLFCPVFLLANDLSYKERSNEGETKYERVGKLENYVSKLSENLAGIHKQMAKDFEKKLKKLEKKLTANISDNSKKMDAKVKPLLDTDFALKSDSDSTQAKIDLYNNKIITLQERVKKLELELGVSKKEEDQ